MNPQDKKSFKKIYNSKNASIGVVLPFNCPEIIESLNSLELDWIWLDGQHSLPPHTWLENIRACENINITPVLRIPCDEKGFICLAFDYGIFNIMIPMVECAEQARKIVKKAYAPPKGSRSLAGSRAIAIHSMEYIKEVTELTTIIAMIETKKGLRNLDNIISVEGIDAVLIGTGDLCIDMDIPLTEMKKSRKIEEAIVKIGKTASKYDKGAGIICEPNEIPKRLKQGFNIFVLSISPLFLSDYINGLLKQTKDYLS